MGGNCDTGTEKAPKSSGTDSKAVSGQAVGIGSGQVYLQCLSLKTFGCAILGRGNGEIRKWRKLQQAPRRSCFGTSSRRRVGGAGSFFMKGVIQWHIVWQRCDSVTHRQVVRSSLTNVWGQILTERRSSVLWQVKRGKRNVVLFTDLARVENWRKEIKAMFGRLMRSLGKARVDNLS